MSSSEVSLARIPQRRRRLPDERRAITHKFSIAGHEGYVTVGMYDDGQPGELFITMAKEGSTVSGLMDSFATAVSVALQYGAPLQVLVDKFSHCRFEPSGFTQNPAIPLAKSVSDYLFRWLSLKFLEPDGSAARSDPGAPACPECGSITLRADGRYECPSCSVSTPAVG